MWTHTLSDQTLGTEAMPLLVEISNQSSVWDVPDFSCDELLLVSGPKNGAHRCPTIDNRGTGFIVHSDGLVMTNAHVIINAETGKPYSRRIVVFKPPRVTGNADEDYANRTTAKVVAADRQFDLALLKIVPVATPLTILKLQDPGAVSIGD